MRERDQIKVLREWRDRARRNKRALLGILWGGTVRAQVFDNNIGGCFFSCIVQLPLSFVLSIFFFYPLLMVGDIFFFSEWRDRRRRGNCLSSSQQRVEENNCIPRAIWFCFQKNHAWWKMPRHQPTDPCHPFPSLFFFRKKKHSKRHSFYFYWVIIWRRPRRGGPSLLLFFLFLPFGN